MTDRRIYVAALGAYNAGRLHGNWIDAELGEDYIWESIKEILASSPIPREEEWAIHDYEGFGSIKLDEWTSPETIAALSDLIEEQGEVPVSYAVNMAGVKTDEIEEFLQDAYLGAVHEGQDEYDWAWDYLEDTGAMAGLPDWLSGSTLDAAVHSWFDGLVNGGEFRIARDGSDGSTHIFGVV
jgi:antirestriction protein